MSDWRRLIGGLAPKARFVAGGALNTALSYLVYLALQWIMDYQLAFLVAYLAGIALSYLINAILVFHQPLSWRTALRFPLVYIVQYFLSAILLALLVELLGISARIAPLVVAVALLPVTYLMARHALIHRKEAV